MKDLVSIIIPVYNGENFIVRCLDTIVAQTYSNIEIVIIDDGSTDNSREICMNYAKKDSRIKFFSKTNGGVSSARNEGLRHISGKYTCFVDADDTIEPKFVEALIDGFNDTDCMITSCDVHISPNIVDRTEEKWTVGFYKIEKAFYELCRNGIIYPFIWNKMFVTQVIKDNNLTFDTSIIYGEDALYLLSYFACIYDKKLAYIPDCKLYNYILNSNSAMQKRISNGFSVKWFDQIKALEKAENFARSHRLYDFADGIKIRKCFIYSRVIDLFVRTGSRNRKEYKELLSAIREELPQFLKSELFGNKVKRQMKICAKSPMIKYYMERLRLI